MIGNGDNNKEIKYQRIGDRAKRNEERESMKEKEMNRSKEG